MLNKYTIIWKNKNEVTQEDKDSIHSLAMNYYPEGRTAYEKNYWYSSIEPDALLTMYIDKDMISYSKYIVNKVNVGGEEKTLAGFSLLTHGDYQRQGIAGIMISELIRSMKERGTDILYATTIFPHVERLLEGYGFERLTNNVIFTHAVTGERVKETEAIYIYSNDKNLLNHIKDTEEFFIGRGPM